jgi:integrase
MSAGCQHEPSDPLEPPMTTEDSMQCSVVPGDLPTVQNLPEIAVPKRELTELRVRDFNTASRMLTVARAVVEINARFREHDAPRFVVKDYPKDREYRRVKLSPDIATLLRDHIQANRLSRDDLIFAMAEPEPDAAEAYDTPPPGLAEVGWTDPNKDGRTYPHGTVTAYNLGGCRCQLCRDACARYRAQRRANGKDYPRHGGLGRQINTDGHIPRRWFAQHIWTPAVAAAGLDFNVRVHDLRHAHASWLLAGGADIQIVKERLGHGSLRTTEKYLHTLPDADETALDALRRTRTRTTR